MQNYCFSQSNLSFEKVKTLATCFGPFCHHQANVRWQICRIEFLKSKYIDAINAVVHSSTASV
jgi:hypothetical protein